MSLLPANLTPQYYAAEDKFRRATSSEAKVEALQEMLAVIPKHKGTERLQGDIKKKIARLKEEGKKKKQTKSGFNPFGVEKQGAGQVVLAGYPNSGKSSIVGLLSRAKVKIAEYPFSTSLPVTGMMPYKDTFIQLVDTPPLSVDNIPSGLIGTFKEADALMIVIDLSTAECLEQMEGLMQILQDREVIDLSEEGVIIAPVPFIVVANKFDHPDAAENLEVLQELMPGIDYFRISNNGLGLEDLKEKLYEILNIIRVYGKPVGKPADMDRPFILRKGSNVIDFAEQVHKDFPKKLKSALVWGSSKFDGQAVARDYILEDGDVVELQL
ncbi:MAG: GTPase [Bacillota bacterium]|nr:GTPase [Bacillota bacterium]